VTDLNAHLDQLDAAGLQALQEEISCRLAALAREGGHAGGESLGGDDEQNDRQKAVSPPTKAGGRAEGQGWKETKIIHGRPYQYFRWWDGDVKRSRYLGKG
jgi:hypothetical protein